MLDPIEIASRDEIAAEPGRRVAAEPTDRRKQAAPGAGPGGAHGAARPVAAGGAVRLRAASEQREQVL